MYTEADLVRVAKRENNSKRDYLVVNRLQGKHIPADPCQSLEMFRALADKLKGPYAKKKLLIVGFAETATAIGAAIAAELGAYYIQTTRENIPGAEYLFFSEEHSHATEQKLVKDGLGQVMPEVDVVLFAEDEVTTGRTILNIVNILEAEYPGQAAYAAASLLNGMDRQCMEVYRTRKIALHYLVKTEQGAYSKVLGQYRKKGMYIPCVRGQDAAVAVPGKGKEAPIVQEAAVEAVVQDKMVALGTAMQDKEMAAVQEASVRNKKAGTVKNIIELRVGGWMDARRLVGADAYVQACMSLWHEIDRRLHHELLNSVLVLGTEEFMYPAMLAAERIALNGAKVRFHATTRSPIAVYQEPQYPLHVRYGLQSLYDKGRKTFLYDIATYDTVLIITDAQNDEREGICSLVRAVSFGDTGRDENTGNKNIYLVRWCLSEK